MVKLKEIWESDSMNLVNQSSSCISDEGFKSYWDAIDAAVKFNITKRKEFISKESAKAWQTAKRLDKTNHGNKQHRGDQDSRDPMYDLFKKRRNFNTRSKDKYRWSRESVKENKDTRHFSYQEFQDLKWKLKLNNLYNLLHPAMYLITHISTFVNFAYIYRTYCVKFIYNTFHVNVLLKS